MYLSAVPSAPRDVSVQITSISSVLVTWQPPEATNGVLDSYIVRIMAGLSTTPLLSRIVNAEGETTGGSAVIRGLELGSYTVTVVAETGAGEGDPSAPLTFTLMTSKITLYGSVCFLYKCTVFCKIYSVIPLLI